MEANGILSQACLLRDYRSKRASSWDRSGGNADFIEFGPGETAVLMEEKEAGCIRHFYWTYLDPPEKLDLSLFRNVVLRAFWDDSDKPSIEVPLGDFFGVCNGQVRPMQSLAFTVTSGADRFFEASWGFNCYMPMPFAKGARIELENQSDKFDCRCWCHIDYELYGTPEAIPGNAGRLHALWNRERCTEAVSLPAGQEEIKNLSGDDNYVILDVAGNGQLAGYFLTVVNNERYVGGCWYGEGDDMVFIDGEKFPPSIHGTGTEEIFGGGAGPDAEYVGPYTGYHCVENRAGHRWWGTNGMYRFYVADPLRFRKSIRVTIEHGHGNDRSNDYASCAFWYQQGTNDNLPALAPPSERQINFQE